MKKVVETFIKKQIQWMKKMRGKKVTSTDVIAIKLKNFYDAQVTKSATSRIWLIHFLSYLMYFLNYYI